MTGVVFVLAQLGLAYFVWKYRERGDGRKATYSHGNNALEVGWTTAATVVFIGLNLIGYRIWANMYFSPAPPDALEIEVQGQQFAYYFRYAG
ncbi:MAG: cytochrome C oxidase subunit II, partial [Acidobacteria bacterium]